MRARVILLILTFVFCCSGIYAQGDPCDFNNNGVPDIGDLLWFFNIRNGCEGLDSLPEYVPEWDCDRDSLHLTVSDMYGLALRLIGGYGWGHGMQWESLSDTIYIPEIEASPGDEFEIPVYLRTDRPLNGFQFYVTYDSDVIIITDFIYSDWIPGDDFNSPCLFDGGVGAFIPLRFYKEFPVEDLIGHLRGRILPGQSQPAVTAIRFGNDSHRASYTGLISANYLFDAPGLRLLFTHPVKVDGVIRILPDGDFRKGGNEESSFDFKISLNPFNTSTRISFEVEQGAFVEIAIYDILGRRIANLINTNLPSGFQEIIWKADDLPSGLYLCRLRVGDMIVTKRITLLK